MLGELEKRKICKKRQAFCQLNMLKTNIMRFISLLIFFLFSIYSNAQPDSRTGAFPKSETKSNSFPNSGLGTRRAPSLNMGKETPLFEKSVRESDKYKDFGKKKEKVIDITKGDGLQEYTTDYIPRGYGKKNEGKMPNGENQSFSDIITEVDKLHVLYRDHQVVDGDRIQVRVNDEIVIFDTMLEAHFKGLHLPLEVGINKVDFVALNQGDSGPNTAELHVYDDDGNLVSSNEWNLLTGYKATVVIIKQADEATEINKENLKSDHNPTPSEKEE